MLDAVNYSEARQNLASLMDNVSDNQSLVIITRQKSEPVVMMSLKCYNSMRETEYLLASPANAERLLQSIQNIEEGKVEIHDLIPTDGDEE